MTLRFPSHVSICRIFMYVLLPAIIFLSAKCAEGKGDQSSNRFYIDSLNAVAEQAYNINYGTSLHLASLAKSIATQHHYHRGNVMSTCLLSLIYVNTNKTKAAIDSLSALMSSAENNVETQSMLYLAMGRCWYYRGDYDSSKRYLDKLIALEASDNHTKRYAYGCLMLAKIYSRIDIENSAIDHYHKAKNFLKDHPDKQLLAWSDDVLGEIYHKQRLYKTAVACFEKSLNSFSSLTNRNGMISSLLHLGNVYYMQMKDDSAIYCYTESLQTAIALGDSTSIAINYSNLSRIFLDHRQTAKAIEYANLALHTIRSGNYPVIEAGTYQQLGDIYGELNQFGRAVQYVGKALERARQAGNKGIVQDCYKSLSELYQAMKQPETAFNYLLAAYRMKDSTQSATFSRQLAEMEIRYGTEKKEAEIKILKQQRQIDNLTLRQQQKRLERQKVFLILFTMMAIAVVVALYFYIQRRRLAEQLRRNEVIRETTDAERLRIAKDIHDELGSGLSKIKLLADIALFESDEKKSNFEQTVHTISHTSSALIENMRDLVWAMNPDNSNLQNLIARIREYSDEYFEDLPIELTMNIPEDVPAVPISKEISRNVFMILKEALQNIVKHSSATAATIRIDLKPKFRIEIADNGKGYDADIKHEGNGLPNMKTRSEAIGGRLHTETEGQKGVKLIFELDKALPL